MKSLANRSPFKVIFGSIALALVVISGAVGMMFLTSGQSTNPASQASAAKKPEFKMRKTIITQEEHQINGIVLDGSQMRDKDTVKTFRASFKIDRNNTLREAKNANELAGLKPLSSYINANEEPVYAKGPFKIYGGGNAIKITKAEVVQANNERGWRMVVEGEVNWANTPEVKTRIKEGILVAQLVIDKRSEVLPVDFSMLAYNIMGYEGNSTVLVELGKMVPGTQLPAPAAD